MVQNCQKEERRKATVRNAERLKCNVTEKHVCFKVVEIDKNLKQNFINLVSDLSKEISNSDVSSTNSSRKREASNTLSMSQEHGPKLRININNHTSKKSKLEPISDANVSKLSTNLGVSTHKMDKMYFFLRSTTINRKLFEPNLKQKLQTMNHCVDSLFIVKEGPVRKAKKRYYGNNSVL